MPQIMQHDHDADPPTHRAESIHVFNLKDDEPALFDSKHVPLLDNLDRSDLRSNEPKLSMWSAAFSIINVYAGLCLLSYPYAIYQGGFLSLIILAIVCIFMSWTGKLLVRCFNRMHPSNKTYPDVGCASYGKYGISIIVISIIFEFFGIVLTCIIFMWDNVEYGLNSLPFANGNIGNMAQIALFCTAAALPTCWLLNFSDMAFVSFLGCTCKILTVLAMIVCFVLSMDTVSDTLSSDQLSMYPNNGFYSLSACIGVFIFSFSGHPALPGIYNSMREPEKFETLLDRCFFMLFVLYSVMGVLGYMLFAQDIVVVITDNLMQMDGEKKLIAQILVMFIICGIYSQVSAFISLLAEVPETVLFNIKDKHKQRIFRSVLFVFCCLFAYLVMDRLAYVEAVSGSLWTMMTSVICPAAFYFALYRKDISSYMRMMLILCGMIGVVCAVVLLFNDIVSLIG
eukprot:331623_1